MERNELMVMASMINLLLLLALLLYTMRWLMAHGLLVIAAPVETVQPSPAPVGMGALYPRMFVTNNHLHGPDSDYAGVDVTGSPNGQCDYVIVAPFSGMVTFNGADGFNHVDGMGNVWPQATMMTIESSDGRFQMTLLHGNYDPALQSGTAVQRGQAIGRAGANGFATGCHDHVTLRDNGQLVNYLEYIQ